MTAGSCWFFCVHGKKNIYTVDLPFLYTIARYKLLCRVRLIRTRIYE